MYYMYFLFEQVPLPHGVLEVNKQHPQQKKLMGMFREEQDALDYIQRKNNGE